MSRRRPAPASDSEDDWLTTYADAITLLMAFFVMLFTLATADGGAFDDATASIASQFSGQVDAPTGGGPAQEQTADPAAAAVRDVIESSGLRDSVEVKQRDRGLVVEFTDEVLFDSGAIALSPQAMASVQGVISAFVAAAEPGTTIEVEGHTDDTPVDSTIARSNWDLSSLRASALAAVLEAEGVPPKRIKVVGYGSALPLVNNRDQAGNPIPENQRLNRRVALVLKRP